MLAEKHRPRSFDAVVGQSTIIGAMRWYLDNAADSGLAFLLTGPSGSGKTTLAECAGRYWGVSEYAVHRIESAECDVTTLRDIDADMQYYGQGGGHKLYIIDEVHTVTGRAADRMLSLLESLPAHVLLVGTTTETDWTDGILGLSKIFSRPTWSRNGWRPLLLSRCKARAASTSRLSNSCANYARFAMPTESC